MSTLPDLFRTAIDTVAAYAWWGRIELESWIRIRGKRSRSVGRHALLIAYYLPPAISSGVFRPASFLKYGSKFGWRLSAISGFLDKSATHGAEADLLGIPRSVEIHRISKSRLQTSWRYFPRIMEDEFCHIFSMYSLASKKLDRDPPSIVIASGPPFTSFVAAYFLARRFDAKLVLDYRDEWSQRPFAHIPRGNSDQLWERRCLRAACAILFTTQSIRDLYLDTFSYLPSSECHVLHNGWEPADFAAQEVSDEAPSDHGHGLVLSYVGVYGPNAHSGNFFTVLAEVLERNSGLRDRFRVRLVGQKSPAAMERLASFERRLPGILDLVEHVPKRDAISLMQQSDALLILAEPELERYRPGKLYDYIAAGPPVLVYGHSGETSELIERLGAGFFVPANDTDALEKTLDQICASISTFPNRSAEINEWLEQHTREALARRFFDILERL